MERNEIIDKVDEPTDWVNSLVIVEKPNGKLRICLDPYDLNKAIKREHYPMRNAESIMAEMADAKFFSKLDASSGYWQIKVDEESSKILTFNTPFGRYKFKRLPFGILSASEVFQNKITEILEGIEGCANVQDGIIIWGKTKEEHNVRLSQVLGRIDKSGLKLNKEKSKRLKHQAGIVTLSRILLPGILFLIYYSCFNYATKNNMLGSNILDKEKCDFGTTEMAFLGHIFSDQGVNPDPKKIKAITNMPIPTNKSDLRRFLGMVTYLGKFTPDLSTKTTCLRQLLESSAEWQWT